MVSLTRRSFGTAAAGSSLVAVLDRRAAAQVSAGGKPHRGGHLRTSYTLEPTSLDPSVGRSGGDTNYLRCLFDPLIGLDKQGLPDPSVSLATTWEVSEQPAALTLTLREGVVFHDGTPFDADAVKSHFLRTKDPATKATSRASIEPITSVDVLGPHKVRLNLQGPWAPGLGTLGDRAGMVNSPAALAKFGLDYGWNPVGTGPFKIKDVVPGSYVHMVRNESYWGRDVEGNQLPYLDEVTIKVIKDTKVLTAALRGGDIDVAYLPNREVDDFLNDPAYHVERLEGGLIGPLLVFNPELAPMDNADLRRAVVQAVSAADINKAVYFNKNKVADAGMWPVGTWAYSPTPSHLGYDVAKARASLAAGGRSNGFEVDIITWSDGDLQRTAEIVRAQLGRIGIKANLTVETVNSATERFFSQKSVPIFLTTWGRAPEPDNVASLTNKSGAFYNPAAKADVTMDRLSAAAAATYSVEQRKALYHQLNDYVLDNALWDPILYITYYLGGRQSVQNLGTLMGADGRLVFRAAWMQPS